MGEQLGDVEHLVEGVDLDDPGLAEHRVHSLLGGRDLAHRVAHRDTLRRASRPHRDDRLGPGDAACDPGELARVTDRLEVEQDHLGGVVLLPVLQQVVARDVGAVAGTDERGQPQTPTTDLLQDRRARGTRLAEEAGSPTRRHERGERGVQGHVRGRVDHAQAVRSDQPQAVGAGQPDQLALALAALLPGLGEAAGDHDQAVDALGGAVEHDVLDRLRGHGDDGDVDVPGDVPHGAVRRHPGHRVGSRVHDVDPARVVAEHEVAHQEGADRVAAARCADDGDAARVHERGDGGRFGTVLPGSEHADRGVGRVDVELEVHHSLVPATGDLVTLLTEHLDHAAVVGKHLGHEPVDPAFATGLGQVLEEELGDAAALVRVLDQEGHLGLRAVRGVLDDVVAPDPDDPLGDGHHERDPVLVVDVGEALHVALGEVRHRGEEPEVLGLLRDVPVEVDEPLGVVRDDRAQVCGPPVAQKDVRFPVLRVVPGGGSSMP